MVRKPTITSPELDAAKGTPSEKDVKNVLDNFTPTNLVAGSEILAASRGHAQSRRQDAALRSHVRHGPGSRHGPLSNRSESHPKPPRRYVCTARRKRSSPRPPRTAQAPGCSFEVPARGRPAGQLVINPASRKGRPPGLLAPEWAVGSVPAKPSSRIPLHNRGRESLEADPPHRLDQRGALKIRRSSVDQPRVQDRQRQHAPPGQDHGRDHSGEPKSRREIPNDPEKLLVFA